MILDGADIIDLGAVSSRPGSAPPDAGEEIARLLPALKQIRKSFPDIVLSTDTYRSETARVALENGADMINDISGGVLDDHMFDLIARVQAPYVLMHMKGNPLVMQVNPEYEDVVEEVRQFFIRQTETLKTRDFNKIILDPGFGFGKTIAHNYQLLNRLSVFKDLGYPLMVGISRKSMIYHVLECKPWDALNGSTVLNTVALLQGADILRVHDVKEARETIRLVSELKGNT